MFLVAFSIFSAVILFAVAKVRQLIRIGKEMQGAGQNLKTQTSDTQQLTTKEPERGDCHHFLVLIFKFRIRSLSWSKGQGAGGKRLPLPIPCRFAPFFFCVYPTILLLLAPCSLPLAPNETEQAELAKVEYSYFLIYSLLCIYFLKNLWHFTIISEKLIIFAGRLL